MPSFELNKQIVQKAEAYGFDFALSMIKLQPHWQDQHDIEETILLISC